MARLRRTNLLQNEYTPLKYDQSFRGSATNLFPQRGSVIYSLTWGMILLNAAILLNATVILLNVAVIF